MGKYFVNCEEKTHALPLLYFQVFARHSFPPNFTYVFKAVSSGLGRALETVQIFDSRQCLTPINGNL
jgi:hypothetical protein